MPDDKGTLELLGENLVLALDPLKHAVSSTTSFRAFLFRLGWDVNSLPQEYVDLADKVAEAADALEALGADPQLDEILAVIAKVRDVYVAVQNLPTAPAGADPQSFLDELPWRLFELLLIDRLAVGFPHVHAVLRALGVIEQEQVPAAATRPAYLRVGLRLEALREVIADPNSVPARAYGWGTGDFGFDALAGDALQLISGLQLPISLARAEEDVAAGYVASTPQLARPPEQMVKIRLLDELIGGVRVQGGIGILELPAESSKPPGIIVQPIAPPVAGEFELADGLKLSLRAGTDLASTLGILVRPGGDVTIRYPLEPGRPPPAVGFGATLDYAPETPKLWLGSPTRSRLQIRGATVSLEVNFSGGQSELRLGASTSGFELVLSPADVDGFLSDLLGGAEKTMTAPFALAWSSKSGLSFAGGAGFEFKVAPHLALGPISLRELQLRLAATLDAAAPPDVIAEAGLTLDGRLGPIAFAVEGVGLKLTIAVKDGNAGPLDVEAGFRPPRGIGLEVDAAAIKGGGFVFFDDAKREYAGILELSLEDTVQLKVIGILDTVLPGNQPGYSLLLIITAEFEPIQLSFGFTLNGVGGLAGVNRTMLLDVLRAGLRNRTLDSILFPQNPIQNAPKIISDLSTIFPPAKGRYAFGPQLKLGWGTPTLITAAVGIFIELPPPIRLAILAQIKTALPEDEAALVEINIDAIGTYEQEKKKVAVDGTLYDSNIVGYVLTGDMAMRLTWGADPFFAVSIGGFNPRYTVPAQVQFPELRRLTLTIGDGDNPRINLETYLAVTSNTAQVGAHLELRAHGGGFGIHGYMGFDALFVFTPFSFVADISAGVDLLSGSSVLMTIHLNFTLSGPTPWHARGKASIDLLFFSVSVSFDARFGSDTGVSLPEVDAHDPLLEALGDPRNWTGALPADRELAATLRPAAPAKLTGSDKDAILAHPFGRLTVREKVVPLDVRISAFGNALPKQWNQFHIAGAQLNGTTVVPDPVQDYFARGQFVAMKDDEKLSSPNFELMTAGAAFGPTQVKPGHSSPLEVRFETFIVDDPLLPSRGRGPYRLAPGRFLAQARTGAAGVSKVWTSGGKKYVEPDVVSAVAVAEIKHVIAATDDLAQRPDVLGFATTQLEAEQALEQHLRTNPDDRGKLQVVPEYEASA